MNLHVPYNVENLTIRTTVSFARVTALHGVSFNSNVPHKVTLLSTIRHDGFSLRLSLHRVTVSNQITPALLMKSTS
jgi:hypothetical protein